MLPMSMVTGIPEHTASTFRNPRTTNLGRIHRDDNEDIEGMLTNEGTVFWSWVYSNPIRLTRFFAVSPPNTPKSITTTIKINSENTILWVNITDNGLLCLLTTNEAHSTAMLSISKWEHGKAIKTISTTLIDPRKVIRHSIFSDEPIESQFSRKSLQCITWNTRSFVVMLPLDKKDEMWLMEIGSHNAAWMQLRLPHSSDQPISRIGCFRHRKSIIYIIPERAGGLFVLDLDSPRMCIIFRHDLPILPTTTVLRLGKAKLQQISLASSMDVSDDGENIVVHVAGTKQLFHLTKSTIRTLESRHTLDISGFSFVGNHAVVCFIQSSREYRLYNLRTRDHVKTFHYAYPSLLLLMGTNSIWSVGPTMSVYRQRGADTPE